MTQNTRPTGIWARYASRGGFYEDGPIDDPLNHSQLSVREVETRWRDHPRGHYLFIFSVMKGATVANAGFILTQPALDQWQRWPFWLVSFLALILSYYGASVGSLLLPLELRLRDTVLPFFLAVAEFSLFSALAASPDVSATPRLWFLVFAGWAALASGVVWSAHSLSKPDYVESPIRPLMSEYRRGMKRDGIASAATAGLAVALYVTYPIWLDDADPFDVCAATVLTIVPLAVALRDQQRHRDRIAVHLRRL